jgi:hypothetical protein
MTDAIRFGRCGILVDHPQTPAGATLATRDRLKLRPTLQLYAPEAIINWRSGMASNPRALTRVVLREVVDVPAVDESDEFSHATEDRWRVLDLVDQGPSKAYRQRVFRRRQPGEGMASRDEFEQVGKDIFPRMNGQPLTYIPFVIIGADSLGADVDEPPLIDLVDMNLSHYRTTAIYEQCLQFCPPTLMLTGIREQDENGNKQEFHVGSLAAITSNDPNANGFYVEPNGAAWQFLLNSLKEKEQRMAVLGARMLESQKAAPETADSLSLQAKGEDAMLASVARTGSLALTQALKWFCEWAGFDSSEVSYQLNRDFYPAAMTPAMLTAAVVAWQAGAPGFSDQGLFNLFRRGELLADAATLEDEQQRIGERGPSFAPMPAVYPALPTSRAQATGLGGKPDRTRTARNRRTTPGKS